MAGEPTGAGHNRVYRIAACLSCQRYFYHAKMLLLGEDTVFYRMVEKIGIILEDNLCNG